jgi:hypothetical protein
VPQSTTPRCAKPFRTTRLWRTGPVRHLVAIPDLARAITTGSTALETCERVLGADHPNTLGSRNNLAGAYRSAGDLSRAIPLYEQTLADSERVLGADHPHTSALRASLDLARSQLAKR